MVGILSIHACVHYMVSWCLLAMYDLVFQFLPLPKNYDLVFKESGETSKVPQVYPHWMDYRFLSLHLLGVVELPMGPHPIRLFNPQGCPA